MYGQHTVETGQGFADGAVEHAYALTGGQPWLVNALAREVVGEIKVPADRAITIAHLESANEKLIKRHATHLDFLGAKLSDPLVRRVVGPMIAGETAPSDTEHGDDIACLRDIGLIAPDAPLRIANPIYGEVIVRMLSANATANVVAEPHSFVAANGRLDIAKLLFGFTEFWEQYVDARADEYHEVGPQLAFVGFLQRLEDGGGQVDLEYGVGRGRIDLLIRWPYRDDSGRRMLQREAMELKVWYHARPDPLKRGLLANPAWLATGIQKCDNKA